MDDLISRKAAIAAAIDGADDWDGGYNPSREEYIRSHMEKVPAVDTALVAHGRWKAYSVPHWTKRYDDNGDPEYKYYDEYVCSACGRRTVIKENFCPKCGAKMDGEPGRNGDNPH